MWRWKKDRLYHITTYPTHDDVIKWKHFPRYWSFVREFTGHWWLTSTKASDAELLFIYFLICAEINGWVKNRDAGDLRCRLAHYDVTVMWRTDISLKWIVCFCCLANCCITGLYDLNYIKCLIINSAAVPIQHGIFEQRGQYAELIGSLIPNGITWYQLTNPLCASISPWWSPR